MVTGGNQCCHISQTTAQDPENPENHASIFIQKIILPAELIAAHTHRGGVQPQHFFFGQLVSLEISHPANEAAPKATYFDNKYSQ